MTAALLLFKYVRYETKYDLQSPHASNIWRVFNQTLDGKTVITQDANTHSAVGPTLKADVAGVADYTRLYCGATPEVVVLANKQPFEIKKHYAVDPGFLRMFPQKVLFGNVKNCLEAPHSAILSVSQAKRLFGKENVLNQRITITHGMMAGDYAITAVVEDVPHNTHLKFDMLLSYATRYATGHKDNFESYWDYTYLQLVSGANPESVRNRLEKINEQFLKKESIRLDIQRFTDIHLNSQLTYELEPNGSMRMVQFLGIIALMILLIAFINYVNLTTALANERAKEIGIRKVLGASKNNLTGQFLFESFVIGLAAFGISILLLHSSIEVFSDFIGSPLQSPKDLFDIPFWAFSGLLVSILSLLTGVYPAWQLSGFQPIETLRGKFRMGSASTLRQSLVVVQFAGSVLLIICVLVVKNQLDFLQKHDLGLSLSQKIAIKTTPTQGVSDTLARQKLAIFKNKVSQLTDIEGSTSSSVVPGLGINTISGSSRPIHWVKSPNFAKITSYFVETDDQFFKLFNIKVLAGKHQFFADRAARFRTLTINETMRKTLGFPTPQSAIGERIAYQNSENGSTMVVGAVVEDFHVESLKTAPHPTLYYCFAPDQLNYLSLNIKSSQMKASLATMQQIWKELYPEKPFSYWFLDENFAHQYRTETQFGKTFSLFAILAIIISCMGLLGLVAYSVERRRKEIGIRKVLGASVIEITMMLSSKYIKLMILAIIFASPIAYYFMEKWLQDFAYRIDIEWWIFALSGIVAIVIALLTVSYQSIKAALANPVKSLRTE